MKKSQPILQSKEVTLNLEKKIEVKKNGDEYRKINQTSFKQSYKALLSHFKETSVEDQP